MNDASPASGGGRPDRPSRDLELDALALLANESDDSTLAFALIQPGPEDRQSVIEELRRRIAIPLHEIRLSHSNPELFILIHQVPPEPRSCVVLSDIETILSDHLDKLNYGRETLLTRPHTVIFLVTESTVGYLGNHAPDFFSWRSGVFDVRGEARKVREEIQWVENIPYSLSREETLNRLNLLRRLEEKITIERKPNYQRQAELYHGIASAHYRLDQLTEAGEYWNKELSLARMHNLRGYEANALWVLGDLKLRTADLKGAHHDYEAVLKVFRQIGERLGEANTLRALGELKLRMGDLKGAREDYEAALLNYRQIERQLGEANTLKALGDLKLRTDDLKGAREDYEAALFIYRRINGRLGEANTLRALGELKLRMGDLKGAREDYEAALLNYRQIERRLGEANTLKALGDLKLRTDDLKGAREDYQAALFIYRRINSRLGEANTLRALGELKLLAGDLKGAREDYEATLLIYRQTENRRGEANTLQGMGSLLRLEGKIEESDRFFLMALTIQAGIQDMLGAGGTLHELSRNCKSLDDQSQRGIVLAGWALAIHGRISSAYDVILALLSMQDLFAKQQDSSFFATVLLLAEIGARSGNPRHRQVAAENAALIREFKQAGYEEHLPKSAEEALAILGRSVREMREELKEDPLLNEIEAKLNAAFPGVLTGALENASHLFR